MNKHYLAVLGLCIGLAGPLRAQEGPLLTAYLPYYRIATIDPSGFDYLTHLHYFILSTDSSGNLGRLNSSDEFVPLSQLPEVDEDLSKLRNWRGEKPFKITVVVGGWAGGHYFQAALGDSVSRKNLAQNINDFIVDQELDGVDLDWETYKTDEDEANYGKWIGDLGLLFEGTDYSISVAVNPTHTRMIPHLTGADFIQLMSYGRFFDGYTQAPLSMLEDWVEDWTSGGVEKERLVLGVPFFGKTTSDNTSLIYKKAYALYAPPPEADKVMHERKSYFYNGPETLIAKGEYIREEDLCGAMIWELGQDISPGHEHSLLQAIRKGLYGPGEGIEDGRKDILPTVSGDLKIYPDPVTEGLVRIDIPDRSIGSYELRLLDTSGKTLMIQTGEALPDESMELDVSSIQPGLYILHYVTKEFRVHGLLLVQ